ncbi:hypothetical protein GALMADRAFT_152004 [Galerina marginata CBS 339.88]|uniref:F-box domain-containing protein n=1 Tax=Galerina marginata (strain CBS 339.88) TaxID=685588 RepID=A0A067TIR2_GALM3|nr:hypothetical protein GALMADRAFT_152004 [Galerina marginata CBS 339.88]
MPRTLTDLATELLWKIFQDLDAQDILHVGVLGRRLAFVAAPAYLARKGLPQPETYCTIRPSRGGCLDEITALTINSSLVSIKQLVCIFPDHWQLKGTSTSLSPISILVRDIRRVNNLISRLSSVGSVCIAFYSMGTQWSLQSDIVQEFMAAFFELLDNIMQRSCTSLQVLHSHPIAFQTNYRFQLLGSPKARACGSIRRLFVKNTPGPLETLTDDSLQGNGWSYRNIPDLNSIPLSRSPLILQSRLTKVDLSSDFLLLPPYAPWIFGVLKSSPLTQLALSLPRAIPADEFRHYIFPRMIAVLPKLEELKFAFWYYDSLSTVVESLSLFPVLRKVAFGAKQEGIFPAIAWPRGRHNLAHLDSFTGSLDQAVYFFTQPISCPNLKFVNITIDFNFRNDSFIFQANLDYMAIATKLSTLNTRFTEQKIEPVITTCIFAIATPILPRLQVQNTEEEENLLKKFDRVSRLNLEIPFFICDVNEITNQADYVLSWLRFFRCVKDLSLISRHFLQGDSFQEIRKSTLLAAINTQHPDISSFEIADPSGSYHSHWQSAGDNFGRYKLPKACVCSNF